MTDSPYRIMLVEPDAGTLETLVGALVGRFEANLTCVSTAEECLEIEAVDPHDLVICELDLEDMYGTELARRLGALRRRPLIVIADDASCEAAIDLMRLGASDLIPKPFRVRELLESAERALVRHEVRRRHLQKLSRMKKQLRRTQRERRELSQRVELVCKDLVGAHRRLVHRVLEFEEMREA